MNIKIVSLSLLASTATILYAPPYASKNNASKNLADLTQKNTSAEPTTQSKKDNSKQEPDPDAEISVTKKIMLMLIKTNNAIFQHNMWISGQYTDENGNTIVESRIEGHLSELEDTGLLDLEKNTAREAVLKKMAEKNPDDDEIFMLDKQTKCKYTKFFLNKKFFLECSTCVTAAQFKRFIKEAKKQRAQQ